LPNYKLSADHHAQKFRDAEARIVRKIGTGQWECELYVLSPPPPATVIDSIYY